MKMNLGSRWGKKLQSRVNNVEFEVGVLDDSPHRDPIDQKLFETPQLKTYAGGPVRKTSRQTSGVTTGDVLIQNMERTNHNFLLEPFQKKNSEIMKFTRYFLQYIVGRPGASIKRIENLLQAIVRNPILNQEYGPNNSTTADNKGFDRHLFDTGQMFKSIRARMIRRK